MRVSKKLVKVSGMQHLNWQVFVVNHPAPNAFVLPGTHPFCVEIDKMAAKFLFLVEFSGLLTQKMVWLQ